MGLVVVGASLLVCLIQLLCFLLGLFVVVWFCFTWLRFFVDVWIGFYLDWGLVVCYVWYYYLWLFWVFCLLRIYVWVVVLVVYFYDWFGCLHGCCVLCFYWLYLIWFVWWFEVCVGLHGLFVNDLCCFWLRWLFSCGLFWCLLMFWFEFRDVRLQLVLIWSFRMSCCLFGMKCFVVWFYGYFVVGFADCWHFGLLDCWLSG